MYFIIKYKNKLLYKLIQYCDTNMIYPYVPIFMDFDYYEKSEKEINSKNRDIKKIINAEKQINNKSMDVYIFGIKFSFNDDKDIKK